MLLNINLIVTFGFYVISFFTENHTVRMQELLLEVVELHPALIFNIAEQTPRQAG